MANAAKTKTNYGTVAYGAAVVIFLVVLISQISLRGVFITTIIAGICFAAWKYKTKSVPGILFGFGIAAIACLLWLVLK